MSVWEGSRGEGISICIYLRLLFTKKNDGSKKLRGKNVGSQRVNMGGCGVNVS